MRRCESTVIYQAGQEVEEMSNIRGHLNAKKLWLADVFDFFVDHLGLGLVIYEEIFGA